MDSLEVEEKMDAKELFMADFVVDKLNFPQPKDMTKLRSTPKIF